MKTIIDKIEFLNEFIVRVPTFPFSDLKMDLSIQEMCSNYEFMTGLQIANFEVFKQAKEYCAGKIISEKENKRLYKTIKNYFIRMHKKTVPFGYFAQLFPGEWGNETRIKITKSSPKLRLDMKVLAQIMDKVATDPQIMKSLKYYSNNTIYEKGNNYRYNEVNNENDEINYKLSSVEKNQYLQLIIDICKNGSTIDNIILSLNDNTYSYEEFYDFICSLISEQILISELRLSGCGKDPFIFLKDKIKGIASNTPVGYIYLEKIYNIETILELLSCSNDPFQLLENLKSEVEYFTNDINMKELIQIDCFSCPENTFINKEIQKQIAKAIAFVSNFKQPDNLPKLEKFKKLFNERYEDAIMPLMEVLDTDTGISFGDFEYEFSNNFSKKIGFENRQIPKDFTDSVSKAKLILYQKYLAAVSQKKYIITINDEDIEEVEDKIDQLATTFQVVFQYFNQKNDLLYLYTVGNSCAGNLISRFAYGEKKLETILEKIAQFEDSKYQHAVVAEIVHVPEYRIANITHRPSFRNYEIPIVTLSELDSDNQITLDDLLVTVRENKIILISKKLNKVVIPRLTNAHNYGMKTLPIYQFLSELNYQNVVPDIQLYLGILDLIGPFVPRVQYNNIILSLAQWTFKPDEILKYFSIPMDMDKIEKFRANFQVPKFITHLYNGKATFIDLEDNDSVEEFVELIKGSQKVFFYEYIFDSENCPTRDSNKSSYCNEVIAFVKNHARNNPSYKYLLDQDKVKTKRNFFPADNWVYFKIYFGLKSYIQFIKNVLPFIFEKYSVDNNIFYLPYNDPEFHLRLRINIESSSKNINVINDVLNDIKEIGADLGVSKVVIDTYKREVERYGNDTISMAERIFSIDSEFLCNNFDFIYNNHRPYLPCMAGTLINSILEAFEYTFEDKRILIDYIYKQYCNEFNVTEKSQTYFNISDVLQKNKKIILTYFDNFENGHVTESIKFLNSLNIFKQNINIEWNQNVEKFKTIKAKNDFVKSIIHMLCIRVFLQYPRQNELITYSILREYYRIIFYKTKNQKQLV